MRLSRIRGVLTAGTVVVSVTVLGCADDPLPVTTRIAFDGTTYEFDSDVSCVRQLDGGLVINAPATSSGRPGGTLVPGRGRKLIRVELLEEPRIVIESAALRFDEVRGFTRATDEMWGTKVGDVYTINGRMPDDDGAHWHQFKIEVTCSRIDEYFVTPHR